MGVWVGRKGRERGRGDESSGGEGVWIRGKGKKRGRSWVM